MSPGGAGSAGPAAFADWLPSWENSFASLARIPDELRIHGARLDGRWVGFAAYYPELRWVTNIAVDPAFRRRGIAARLMDRLLDDVSGGPAPVKLINVEAADAATAALAEKAGFAVYARQYEMEREL
ncbi:MAG: GNAT family N-acetyltransferase [Acidobacteria bacterium]|nr:GNAT family N-acetyltransferase [Acidobacteriota bacterium]HNQ80154.1 GNAT family N-acetyltransferase [Candidatus Aminicenantes bacterium]MDD8009523.1 GNAT family N-acetyltransferase [Acidobacteriota bacterium]NMD10142.1 GNAT family N-acetyltransferase [Acidobacteriota bacterium]HNT33260.1 GNAT family N-acetyltransferase [Candidatus Aminicenantes bacterium]